jgi:hypothetical protein
MKHVKLFEEFVTEYNRVAYNIKISGSSVLESKKVKRFDAVKVGDMANESPDAGGSYDNELGKILWKGNAGQLVKSKYKNLVSDWGDGDFNAGDYEDWDFVVINRTGAQGGPELNGYDMDPSSVVVF